MLHGWLVTHRHLGPYLARYQPGRRLSPRDLTLTLAVLWISISVSIVLAMPQAAGRAALIGVATAVSVYLVSRGPARDWSRRDAVRP